MTAKLVARFEKQFPGAVAIHGELNQAASDFSVTVLFGPSGCGKTTVLRCLAGLERPDSGTICFGDETWTNAERGIHWPPQQRGIGFLFQDYALFPHLTVAGNIGYGLTGLSASERGQRVTEMLDRFELKGLEHRYPHQVSGGQQQRVALARVLVRRPRLLLLDEPLSALDASLRDELRWELRELLSTFQIPVVVVTHDRIEAIALADSVIVMDAGRIRQSGKVEEVFGRPVDPTVARIVGVETVVPAQIVRIEEGLATISVGGTELVAIAPGPLDGTAFACIRAEEVIIQRGTTEMASVRNRLRARVTKIIPEGPMNRVTLDCGFLLSALVTRPACTELRLEPGETVFALLNAPGIHLIPRD